jgi:uncharacterized protein (TIGR00255 family)
MLKSMTAFGRSEIETPLGRFVVEIQSVNRKFLEIQTHLPKELWRFDTLMRQWVGTKIFRGQVNVRVQLAYDEKPPNLGVHFFFRRFPCVFSLAVSLTLPSKGVAQK